MKSLYMCLIGTDTNLTLSFDTVDQASVKKKPRTLLTGYKNVFDNIKMTQKMVVVINIRAVTTYTDPQQ